MNNALPIFETKESRREYQIFELNQKLVIEKFSNNCERLKLFWFQWQIEKYFGPGLSSISPCCNNLSVK